jgi:DNA-binding IclR family transcriptional regulator
MKAQVGAWIESAANHDGVAVAPGRRAKIVETSSGLAVLAFTG